MRCNDTKFGSDILKIIKVRTKGAQHEVIVFQQNGLCSVTTQARDGSGRNVQRVDLNGRKCDCGKWQHDGIPCSHVFAICCHLQIGWEGYISDYYKIDSYEATYLSQFRPLAAEIYWKETNQTFLPNSSRLRKKGRPKSTRFRNGMDISERRSKIRCSGCQNQGHDIRKCPNRANEGGRRR